MDSVCIKSFKLAMKMQGIEIDKDELIKCTSKIKTYEDLKAIDRDNTHILYPWVPALVYDILGYNEYKSCDLNIDESDTYLLFRPGESFDNEVYEALQENGDFEIQEFQYVFSKKLISHLYGGFPWFLAYCSTCDELNIWDKTGIAVYVKEKNDVPCIKCSVEIKNRYRDKHPEKTKEINLSEEKGCGYNGIIHSFHCPNCIEKRRHSMAIEKARL